MSCWSRKSDEYVMCSGDINRFLLKISISFLVPNSKFIAHVVVHLETNGKLQNEHKCVGNKV